jgi:signal transduction histidine kinase
LFVVHGIATAMGATITVDSKIGHGTTFRVYFPAKPVQRSIGQSTP